MTPGGNEIRSEPIPVTIITGFLGSGKTTLLNRLLAHPRMARTAVLINEFGEVGIDQLIVREIDPDAVLLKSGCICCTVQGELVDGLKEIFMKRATGALPPFERVAIETTGLADPLPIVACLMRDPLFKHAFRLGGLITTVDAQHGAAQLERHVEAARQAAVADRIVITKGDLAGPEALERIAARMAEVNPTARILRAVHGEVEPEALFEGERFELRARPDEVRKWVRAEGARRPGALAQPHERTPSRHDEHIVSHCVVLDEPVNLDAFRRWYDEYAERRADHLLRVKGILNVRGQPRPVIVHCVQATQHVPMRLPAWPDSDRRSRIVFITSDLPGREIEASLRGYLAQWKDEGAAEAANAEGSDACGIWLNEAELTRMFSALARCDDWVAANVLRVMLLTGASCDEVRAARWEEIDLDQAMWRKAAAPGGTRARVRRIPLGAAAVMLLRELQGESDAPGSHVFSCAEGEIPMRRLDAAWRHAARIAGIGSAPLESFRPVLAANLFRGLPDALTRRLLGLGTARGPRKAALRLDASDNK